MSGQIKFAEKQTHKKSFEMGVLAFSALCIVFTIICIFTVSGGTWT